MRLVLFFAGAAAALSAAPAMADNDQRFDWQAQMRAFSIEGPPSDRQCFNGKFILGANRSGERTLYVQPRQGGIYEVQLRGSCSALNSAEKITLRSGGSDAVCVRQGAEVVVHTPTGAERCRASDVRKLTSGEAVALSRVAQR